MRSSQLILSALHFLVLLFLVITGAACILLATNSELKTLFIGWLEQTDGSLKEIGIAVLTAALCFLLLLHRLYRTSYLSLKSEQGLIKMDMQMVQNVIENWWQEKYSHKAEIIEVYLAPRQKLSIVAKLAQKMALAPSELSELESALSQVLSKQLGYKKPFYLHLILNKS